MTRHSHCFTRKEMFWANPGRLSLRPRRKDEKRRNPIYILYVEKKIIIIIIIELHEKFLNEINMYEV